MVFVADTIPTELRRIVEFLNEQIDPAEILAVEVRQFVGTGAKNAGSPSIWTDGNRTPKEIVRHETWQEVGRGFVHGGIGETLRCRSPESC